MLRLNFLLVATLLASSAAFAQGDPGAEEKSNAARLLDEGNKLFADHDYAGAIVKYDEAYKAYPSWKILLNLAEAHRSAGHADRAADLFEKVRDTLPPSAASQLPRIEERLNELKSQLGQLLVTSDVEGAHVFIDGYDIGQTPMPARRVVAGHHALRIEASGRPPVLAEVDVVARSLETFNATLKSETPEIAAVPSPTPSFSPSPTPAVVPPPIETTAQVPPDEGGSSAIWWILGAVAVAAAAGVTVAVVASSSGDTFVPGGELGRYTTSDGWTPINRGGL
jgi:hypothetical protein